MDKTKGIGAGLLLVSIVFASGWLYVMLVRGPAAQMLAIKTVITIALLAVFGLVGWIGYTMASMKIEVPAPPPPASPPTAEKKS